MTVRVIFKILIDFYGQNKFFEFIVGLDRVARDKLFGVGMTLPRPRVCPLETV